MSVSPTALGRRLHNLAKQSTHPILVFNSSGRVVFANEAWLSLSRYPLETTLNLDCRGPRPVADASPESLAAALAPPANAWQQPSCKTTVVVDAEGDRHWSEIHYWPVAAPNERSLSLLAIIRPVNAAETLLRSPASSLADQLTLVRERMRSLHRCPVLIGSGHAQERLHGQIETAAQTQRFVAIVGESGVGKRTVARAIHERSNRSGASLVWLDAEALPLDSLNASLFADRPDANLDITPESARDVMFVLGDLAAIPRDLQASLAAVEPARAPRLVLTSLREPEHLLIEGILRDDFYHRVTHFLLRLPPLRDRLHDVPLLAQHFLESANTASNRPVPGFAPEAIDALVAYDWPGNIRELKRVVEACHAAAENGPISASEVPATIRGNLGSAYLPPTSPSPIPPLDATLENVERRLLESALRAARQNKSRAADMLSISRPRLYRRMKELDIPDLPEAT